jgi:hypothetical protein
MSEKKWYDEDGGWETKDMVRPSLYDGPKKTRRFWMPPGSEKVLIFLDDEPFVFWEHNLKLNGSWRNWFTCLAPMGMECPLCKLADTTWEKVKRRALQRVAAGDTLRGAMISIFRSSKPKSPAVGEEFEFVKMVDLKAYPDTAAVNYLEELKPNPAQVKAAAAQLGGEVAGEGVADEASEPAYE